MAEAQESVWDYPRPPRLEPAVRADGSGRLIRVVHRGVVIAESTRVLRVLETSHPPVYYIPPGDIAMEQLRLSARRSSFCEFKGYANYYDLEVAGSVVRDVAWSYPKATAEYAALEGYLAFYASRVEECWVDGERVQPQPGDFYGGWITAQVRGPFKGAPGTLGW